MFERERTTPYVIRYALDLCFLGLSLRRISKAIEPFAIKTYVANGNGYKIQFKDISIQIKERKTRIAPSLIADSISTAHGSKTSWSSSVRPRSESIIFHNAMIHEKKLSIS
jgi:hypothetical protein